MTLGPLEVSADLFLDAIAGWPQEDQDAAFWLRCRDDRELFAVVAAPERFPSPFNAMHRDFLSRPKVAWRDRETDRKEADAAPRGGAKSTVRSFLEPIHDVVYGLEAYIAIISTTYNLAEDLVADLYGVFTDPEAYPELHQIWGPFTVTGTKTDFVVNCPTGEEIGTRIKAFSQGSTIRGQKHRGIRITKAILDDYEHQVRVRSPIQREKTDEFLTKDVEKAGPTGRGMLIWLVGTVLHADSTLARRLKSAAWSSTKWRAIISWPSNMGMWAAARELWADLSDPDRVATAEAFYLANKAVMDAGAEVLWPESESLWDLMQQWWENAAAFNSEKQNEPVDPTRQVYDPDTFRRCKFDGVHITTSTGRKVRVRDCKLALWLDPRASREIERNDYAAIALVARDPVGYVYVLACDMKRDASSSQRARYWKWWERYSNAVCGYEDNGFQALYGDDFDREREERRKARLPWRMAPRGHRSTENKNDRLVSLEPDFTNGWIEVCEDVPQLVMEQWRDVPSGSHDDGPDAIERAIWLVRGGEMGEITPDNGGRR